MLADEGGEFVVLGLFEGFVVKGGGCGLGIEPFGQVIEYGGVVEDAMQVASPAMIVEVTTIQSAIGQSSNGGLFGPRQWLCVPHVNLVSFASCLF